MAARSYALANLAKGRPFDLYRDTRSQVYGGIDAESPRDERRRRCDPGRGRALQRHGRGHLLLLDLRRSHGVGARGDRHCRAVPRLGRRSVRHALAVPRLGPRGHGRDEGRRRQLKLSAPIADLETANGPSGRVRSVTVVSADDSQVTLTGDAGPRCARPPLDLVHAGSAGSYLPAAKTMTYGGAVSLTGMVHGADTVSLESKTPAQPVWTPAGRADARRRRRVLDDRPAAGDDAVPPRVGRRARRPGEDRRCAARRRDRRPQLPSAGRSDPRVVAAAVQLQQQSGDDLDDRLVDGHRLGGGLELLGRAVCRHLSHPLRAGPGTRTRRLGNARRAVRRWRRDRDRDRRARGARGGGGVRQPGASCGPPVVPRQRSRLVVLADAAAALSDQRRRDRLGHRRDASRVHGSSRGREVVRRRLAVPRRPGPRNVRRGEIAANPFNGQGIAGMAFNARLMIAKVVEPDGYGLAQGRGRGDPLGGRQRRARDQSQPRRRPRSARSVARHLFAARAGGGRVRVFERRGRGRGGRQRPAVAGDAVGLRALSGVAART